MSAGIALETAVRHALDYFMTDDAVFLAERLHYECQSVTIVINMYLIVAEIHALDIVVITVYLYRDEIKAGYQEVS